MFMRKSTHRMLMTRQGEAYRWELDEQKREINLLKRKLDYFFDKTVPVLHIENTIPYNNWRLTIEIDAQHLAKKLPQEILQDLTRRIMERLTDFNKDYRPDLREQTKNAHLFIR